MDFIILKINGQDLTHSTHEEAVEAFQTAKEPIVVEVLRRVSKGGGVTTSTTSSTSGGGGGGTTTSSSSSSLDNKMKNQLPSMVSTATQTDEYIEDAYFSLFCPPTSPFGMCGLENLSLVQPSSRHGVAFDPSVEMGLTDLEVANGLEYDEDFDPDRTFDMEYEEVTLHRRSTKEKIGLTLCYGNTEDEVTDIFISEVEPYSIAARDGRIREGDQILQINSTDVHNREQAIQLFSENRSDITLLLARPQVIPMDDGFMDGRNALDDLQGLEVLDQTGRQDLDFTATVFAHGNEEEGATTDTATTENSNKHEKDSGVGRTDDSTRNDESSEQELMENECVSPASNSKFGNELEASSAELHYSNDSFTSNDMAQDTELASSEIPAEECAKFREVLETRCSEGAGSREASPRKRRDNSLLTRKDSESSIEREIAALNYEMEQIHLECQEIVEAHAREQHRAQKPPDGAAAKAVAGGGGAAGSEIFRSPRLVPRMGTRLDYLKQLHAGHDGSPQEPLWLRHCEHLARTNPTPLHATAVEPSSSSGASTMDSNARKPAKEAGKDGDPSTTSAYNTGDSCRSTPLTLELQQGGDDDSGKGRKSSMLCLAAPTTGSAPTKPSHSDSERLVVAGGAQRPTKEWSSDGDAKPGALSKSQSNSSVSRMSQTQEQDDGVATLQKLYAQYAEVMYTNRANLQHTIMVQQKLFQQQLMQRARQQAVNGSSSSSSAAAAAAKGGPSTAPSTPGKCPTTQEDSGASPSHSSASHRTDQWPSKNDDGGGGGGGGASSTSCNASGAQMEWVVKKRADGSRYITRRPVRSKILKERARKINDERAGMTTDDDAASEMKVGRYWSKEERKRHLEKAKDHRRRKELLIRQKMETVKEGDEQEPIARKEPNIVELSHRKMMKHKGRKVFDDFTTLQEMLAHGSREPQGKTYNPLLSVTTV